MTTRREFLQTTAAIAGSFILPTSLFATPSSNCHFIHADSCKDWPVHNPVEWSLQNAHQPILARAADGLKKLTPDDADRIIRLVLRRCSLNDRWVCSTGLLVLILFAVVVVVCLRIQLRMFRGGSWRT